MSECRCDKPTRDDRYVCEDCLDQLAQALNEMQWLDDELEITIGRHRGIDYRALGGSSGAEAALPWHEAASEARRHLRAVLVQWVLFCDEEDVRNSDPGVGMPDDTMPSMARWLLWRLDGLALLDIGPEAHDQITSAVGHCRRLIDRRPDRWYAGPCTALTIDEDFCHTDLYARSQHGTVKCPECEATYDVAERREWLLGEAEDRLATATDVARAVSWLGAEPLSPSRVWKWAERGRIVAHGHDGRHPLYRIGDAIDLLADETEGRVERMNA